MAVDPLGLYNAKRDFKKTAVVLNEDGHPSFGALREAIKTGDPDCLFFSFDVLELDGIDLKKLPNIERKERLRPTDAGRIL